MMSEQSFQLSSLTAIRDRAANDLTKLRRELERVKSKVDAAEMRLATLDETIAQLSSGLDVGQPKSQKDMILEMINVHDGDGLTAREIATKLEEAGFKMTSQNPAASIHVAAEQLKKEGKIEITTTDGGGKVFKRKVN